MSRDKGLGKSLDESLDKSAPSAEDREKRTTLILWGSGLVLIAFFCIRFMLHGKKEELIKPEMIHESYLNKDMVRELESRYYLRSAGERIEDIRTNLEAMEKTNRLLSEHISRVETIRARVIIKERKGEEGSKNYKSNNDLPDIITR